MSFCKKYTSNYRQDCKNNKFYIKVHSFLCTEIIIFKCFIAIYIFISLPSRIPEKGMLIFNL